MARCLESVHAAVADVEVIVADGGSTDGTAQRASRDALVIPAARGRGAQMNAGARAAGGDVLLFLHGDTVLPPGWADAVGAALDDPSTAGGTFQLRFDVDALALRVYTWFTRVRWRIFHYGDQGIFVRREVFERIGGFREWPLMEDVDLLARLAAEGRVALLPLAVTTSARRFQRHGVIRQQLLNAALVMLFHLGVAPQRLARWYENVHR